MATRAERAHAESQRTGAAAKRRPSQKTSGGTKRKGRAEAKATYDREERDANGRASRRSTRGSGNRAKPDAAMNIREELVMASPSSRARHDIAKRDPRTKLKGGRP